MMTREHLISHLSGQLGWSEQNIANVLDAMIDTIVDELNSGNSVNITDFGVFKTIKQPEYILIDQEVNQRHLMPPSIEILFEAAAITALDDNDTIYGSSSLNFLPDENLEKEANNSFLAFEPTLLNEGVRFSGLKEVYYRTRKEIPKEDPKVFRKRKKRASVWMPVLGGMAIALAVLFFFKGTRNRKALTATVNSPVLGTANRLGDKSADTLHSRQNRNDPPEETTSLSQGRSSFKPNTSLRKVGEKKLLLPKGSTLRMVAEDVYGNREFWVYIYLENKQFLKNPNVIDQGTELTLPDPSQYDIDPNNTQSVAKAKLLGDEILKKWE